MEYPEVHWKTLSQHGSEVTVSSWMLKVKVHFSDCRGVTFTGVIVPHAGEPNCLLVACRGDSCEMNQRSDYTDGLISVLINRTQVIFSAI